MMDPRDALAFMGLGFILGTWAALAFAEWCQRRDAKNQIDSQLYEPGTALPWTAMPTPNADSPYIPVDQPYGLPPQAPRALSHGLPPVEEETALVLRFPKLTWWQIIAVRDARRRCKHQHP